MVCDLDGVLVDSSACHAQAFDDLWRALGIAGPTYETIAGRATREVIAEVTAARGPSAVQLDEWVQFKQRQARGYLATQPILYDDTIESLEAIARRLHRLALGTSASRATTEMLLRRFGLERFFPDVVTADDVTQGKPAPEIYRTVMTRAGARPEEALIVEDSAWGITAALASGATVAAVRSGRRTDHARFLGSFPDLRTLVRRLEEGAR